ncbi:hypothetical protein V8F20_007758 [Naviculisporaceae sp. PSN 640]
MKVDVVVQTGRCRVQKNWNTEVGRRGLKSSCGRRKIFNLVKVFVWPLVERDGSWGLSAWIEGKMWKELHVVLSSPPRLSCPPPQPGDRRRVNQPMGGPPRAHQPHRQAGGRLPRKDGPSRASTRTTGSPKDVARARLRDSNGTDCLHRKTGTLRNPAGAVFWPPSPASPKSQRHCAPDKRENPEPKGSPLIVGGLRCYAL